MSSMDNTTKTASSKNRTATITSAASPGIFAEVAVNMLGTHALKCRFEGSAAIARGHPSFVGHARLPSVSATPGAASNAESETVNPRRSASRDSKIRHRCATPRRRHTETDDSAR